MQSEHYDPLDPKLPSNAQFHSDFSSLDTDVIISTSANASLSTLNDQPVFFRVHAVVLTTTCGFFRSMFSLPHTRSPSSPEILYMTEDTTTLEYFLRMICGLPFPPLRDSDLVESLLDAAEKYDSSGVMNILRLVSFSHTLSAHPLWLYAVSYRFGWEEEVRLASSQTLSYNIHDPGLRPFLQKLSTKAVLDLFELHHTRREGLRQRLNDPPFVQGGRAVPCGACNHQVNHWSWRELKAKIFLEIDARPLGDTILNHGLVKWEEAITCWAARCECKRALYDRDVTVQVVSECIESLPREVKVCILMITPQCI
ncbi:hypothetical protein DL96DRAFT_1527936 [Flagelloscypha sp. PMI_526]|nr:hypothetical protein DL96DRAFT_1527936 [Flagelloscypha sp. PMI_526]